MELYNFFRSGTSHRLRIALNLKEIDYEYIPISLTTDENFGVQFKLLNPQGLVPALVTSEGDILTQSPAIIEWLEELYPTPALLPDNAIDRAHVRALAALVGCDIHPLNNKRVLEYLRHNMGKTEADVMKWCNEWIALGFQALEEMLVKDKNRTDFCFGDSPTFADVYLIPQVESAKRFGVDLLQYPNILAINDHCLEISAFREAAPNMQIDSPTFNHS